MKYLVAALLTCVLVAFGSPAQAVTIDTSRIVTLTPGAVYLCERLDGHQLPTGSYYTLAVSLDADGRYELDLDQDVPFSLGSLGTVPLGVRAGSFVVGKGTTGYWTLYDVRSGFSLLDQVFGAAVIPKGVPVPLKMAPDTSKHVVVSARDGSGAALSTGGCDVELISLNYNLAVGYLVSWTFDAGQSVSLWSDGKGHLAGIELDWSLYRIVGEVPSGPATGAY